MAAKLKILLFVLVFCYVQLVKSEDVSGRSDSLRYEALLSKMDYIDYKFLELELEIKDQNEQIMQNQDRLEKTHEGMAWMMTRMEQVISQNSTTVMDQSWKILQQQKICANHDRLRKAIFNLKPKELHTTNSLYGYHQFRVRGPFASCKVEPSKLSGKYTLQPSANEESFVGYCEQAKFGGGWLVIQRRFDGSVDFYRNWTEYKNGFGEADKEFWIGLEILHKITNGKSYHLLVELEDFNGDYKYSKYAGFEIGSEAEKYPLKTLGAYSGTGGDSLTYHKGMKFTTVDNDNDAYSYNCATLKGGAWWYNACTYSNLNGHYTLQKDTDKSMHWYYFGNSYNGMKYSRMLIREV